MKILITSPSLNVNSNVSGIATHTRLLLTNNKYVNYIHFEVGKKDSEKRDLNLFFSQFGIIYDFYKILLLNKDIDIVHLNMPMEVYSIIKSFLFVLISRIMKVKILLHVRGGFYSRDYVLPAVFNILIKKLFAYSSGIIVLGENEKKLLLTKYQLYQKSIFVLPNATNIPIELDGKNENEFNIIYFGRIDLDKGLDFILNTLLLLKKELNFKFFIAGKGPDSSYFLEECIKLFPLNFTYLGILNDYSKDIILKKCHIFFMPSKYEGLPNSMIESMAYGLIPIVTPVGAIPEVIIDNENGILIKNNDPSELVKVFQSIANSSSLRNKLSKNSRKTAFDNYNIEKYIIKINNIYEAL